MKRMLVSLALLALVACGNEPAPKSPGVLTGTRCAFGEQSYPSGERVCQNGHEMECREDANSKPSGTASWLDTGKACKSGEPAAVPSPPAG